MTDKEVGDAMRAIVVAMTRLLPTARWRDDEAAFARAIDGLRSEGNALATRFYVYDGAIGRCCHEFREVLSEAAFSGLISHVMGRDEFVLDLSPKDAERLARRIDDEDRIRDAEAIVVAYARGVGMLPER